MAIPAGRKQGQEPLRGRKFIVVDKRHEVAVDRLDGRVSRQGNILTRLHAIFDLYERAMLKTLNFCFSRTILIVINDNNRKR